MTNKSELITEDENITTFSIQQERHMKLMELALQNKADIASIEKLVQLQNDFEVKESRKAFFAALSRFQSQLPVIEKKGLASFEHRNGGGQTSYSYAKLEDIAKAVKPLLVENGLSYRYEQRHEQQMITVVCIVTHEDGHEERTEMSAFADTSGKKNEIQQAASTVSYLRRYTMTGALGITVSDEDNDAADYQAAPMQQFDQGVSYLEAVKSLIKAQGKTQEQFFNWASECVKREVSSFEDLTEQELYRFSVKLRNAK